MYIVQIRVAGFLLRREPRGSEAAGLALLGGRFILLTWDSCKLCRSSSGYGDRTGRSAERGPFEGALY